LRDIVGSRIDIAAEVNGIIHKQTCQRSVGVGTQQAVPDRAHIDEKAHVGEIDTEPTLHSCLCQSHPLVIIEVAHLLICELLTHFVGSNA